MVTEWQPSSKICVPNSGFLPTFTNTHTHNKKCQSKAIAQDLFRLYGPFFHQHKVFLSWKAVNSIPFIFLCHLPSPPWSIQCQSLSGLRPHIQSLSSRAGDSAQKCWCNCGWLWSSTELSQLQHLDELEKLIKYTAMRAVRCSLKPCKNKNVSDANPAMTWTKNHF